MAKEYAFVRLTKTTKAALEAMMGRMVKAHELGHADCWWAGETLTADDMVMHLIRHVENDKRRGRESRKRRRHGPTVQELEAGEYCIVR